MKLTTSKIISISMIFGLAFWLANGVFDYFLFEKEAKLVQYQKSLSLIEALLTNIPFHSLFSRILFMVMILICGGIIALFLEKSRLTDIALAESESKYKNLQDSLPIGIFGLTSDWEIKSANKGLVNILGYNSEDELININLKNFFTIDSDFIFIREKVNKEKLIQNYETEFVTKEKQRIWVSLNIAAKNEIECKIHCLNGFLVNISEKKTARDALEYEIKHKEIILDSLVEYVTYVDKDLNVLWANKSACEAYNISREDFIGKKCFSVIDDGRNQCEKCPLIRCMETGKPEEYEKVTENRIKLIKAYPVFNPENEIIGAIDVALDITNKKQNEIEKLKLEEQLKHAKKLESLGVLAGGISHDFNNLLMGILGNADLAMQDLNPTSPIRNYIIPIIAASRRAAELCQQMLAYSGKGRFVIETVNINDLITQMTHIFSSHVSTSCRLKYNLKDDISSIEVDTIQLKQIFLNLIENASDAIGENDGTITIATGEGFLDKEYLSQTYISSDLSEGEYIFFEVEDNGCGMDDDVKSRIFDPFFSTKLSGRGLGMAAVLGIVRGHKGGIKVESVPGEGSKITVILPKAKRLAEKMEQMAAVDTDWHGTGYILLVDDEKAVRDVAKKMIMRMGFTVITADDGVDAIEVYNKNKDLIKCVVLDMTMPRMDGREAFHKLKEINPDLKILMSSGYDQDEIQKSFEDTEFDGFVQKPYESVAIKALLKKIMG